AARSDRDQILLGLDHVPGARDQERVGSVRDAEQRLEPAQHPVGAPVLRELDRAARQVAVLVELLLEQLEQRECIGRAAGESGEHAAVAKATDLAGIAFHDLVAHRDLAVAPDRDAAVTAYTKNRRAVKFAHRPSWSAEIAACGDGPTIEAASPP